VGAFYSSKNSEIFATGTNGMKIPREKFQEIWKFLTFRKEKQSKDNSGNSEIKKQMEWNCS